MPSLEMQKKVCQGINRNQRKEINMITWDKAKEVKSMGPFGDDKFMDDEDDEFED